MATSDMTDIDVRFMFIQNLKAAMADELGPLKSQMQDLEAKMREMMDPFVAQIQEHEDCIREAVMLQEKSYKGEHGKATFRKGYSRYSWDNQALEGYVAAGHEEILQFRKESFVQPAVMLEVI